MKASARCFSAAAVLAAVASLLALAGCAAKDAAPAPDAQAMPTTPEAPGLEQLLVATVTGPWTQPVTLVDGRYDGPPVAAGAKSHPTLVLLRPSMLLGDLDGSPPSEAVALLAQSEGGSGEFTHLAVFAMRDGRAQSIATIPVGDRVQLFRAWLERDQVHMDVIEAAPGEPACCPTRVSRKAYGLRDGELALLENAPVSSLSVNLLAATDWMLSEMDGEAVPQGVLPPTALIQYGKIVGFAGCNRYQGPLTESKPGSIKLGALVTTRKACDDAANALETRFLAQLGRADGYTFQAGRLVLHGPSASAGGSGTLVFAR